MKYLRTTGRILFAIPFGIFGLNHFFMYNYYLGIVSSFIPGGGFTVIITGIALIAASISMIAKKYIQISCLLLALMLLIFILTIHVPGLFTGDPNQQTIAFIELMKDTALMGGSLFIAGIYRENKEKV
jgi:putative oxidoreductase